MDFTTIDYLKSGNERQQAAYHVLTACRLFEILAGYRPILTGTIPIAIDLPESDLDVICCCNDFTAFTRTVQEHFSGYNGFEIHFQEIDGESCVISRFTIDDFLVELFAQNMPTEQQRAYRHMLVEYHVLKEKGDDFRKQIIALKKQGMKTEPAFAHLLGLPGEPYSAILSVILA